MTVSHAHISPKALTIFDFDAQTKNKYYVSLCVPNIKSANNVVKLNGSV